MFKKVKKASKEIAKETAKAAAKKAIHASVNGVVGTTKAVVKTAEIVTSIATKGAAETTKNLAKEAGEKVVKKAIKAAVKGSVGSSGLVTEIATEVAAKLAVKGTIKAAKSVEKLMHKGMRTANSKLPTPSYGLEMKQDAQINPNYLLISQTNRELELALQLMTKDIDDKNTQRLVHDASSSESVTNLYRRSFTPAEKIPGSDAQHVEYKIINESRNTFFALHQLENRVSSKNSEQTNPDKNQQSLSYYSFFTVAGLVVLGVGVALTAKISKVR